MMLLQQQLVKSGLQKSEKVKRVLIVQSYLPQRLALRTH
nr:MAG TPA: hypothetical protein [Caudoviricetes sp.]